MSALFAAPYNGGAYFVTSIAMLTVMKTFSRALSSTSAGGGIPRAPVAKRVADKIYFGINPKDTNEFRGNNAMNPPKERDDAYNWLRDETRKDPEVIAHLNAENAFCEESMSHLKNLRETLYNEMLSHLKETDEEVPHRDGDYLYYSKTQKGLSYKIHCRKALEADAEEIIVMDENKLAKGHEYSDMQMFAPSPSHKKLAYSIDHSGYETYQLRVVEDILTGKESDDAIEEISGEMIWGADDSTLFYMLMDEEHRPHKLYMHVLGTPQSEDVCVYTEDDGMFWMGAGKTQDDKFLIFGVESKETSECYAVDLQGVRGAAAHKQAVQNMQVIKAREFGVRYEVEHHEGQFYITTNADGAKNNKLVTVPVAAIFNDSATTNPAADWVDVKPYNSSEQIDEVIPFKNFIAVFGREQGIQRLWIMDKRSSSGDAGSASWRAVPFPEIVYSIWSSHNCVFDSDTLRLGYSSLVTPRQVIDYNMETGEQEVLKQVEVPLYDARNYECRRMEALSRDGKTKIPMSMVFNKQILRDRKGKSDGDIFEQPCLLYGYGSYGACMDPTFDFKRAALLDRGVVYVIAHIRGGGEMGRGWYEDEGKYLTKLNTFHDFIDCGKHLVDTHITRSDLLSVVGRSAGGLLIGAVVNMQPDLFKAAVADVPFVDALNTMSDPTIPLTVTEWEEWGNPNEEKYFDYMQKYSPYDNVKAQAYPSLLITAGLNDPRVAYWEPAKWAARLRELKTDSNKLLLKTDMSSGHFSASDRYKFIKETAFEFAFILEQIGAKDLI